MKQFFSNLAFVLALSLASYSCGAGSRESRLMREGDKIVARIESFKKEKQRLPESLSEVGVKEKEEGPIYYAKKSDTRYVLCFGMELGESVIYDSDTGEVAAIEW
ncbi:MAG TPA: hypothetical protein VIQ24_10865 [Pyrinomonadaceae bacterium]